MAKAKKEQAPIEEVLVEGVEIVQEAVLNTATEERQDPGHKTRAFRQ